MSRVDQYEITVKIDGMPHVDDQPFDKMSGGGIDSEELKYKPGAMGDELSLGGSRTVGNVTVSRLFVLGRDDSLIPNLKKYVGNGDVTITKQSLDLDKNPFGEPMVYKGKLKAVNFPEPDSEANTAAMLELEISTAGTIG